MPQVNGLFSRLSWSVPPFERPVRVLVVADPTTATVVARPLRAARAEVAVAAEVDLLFANPDCAVANILLIDMRVSGAWDWLTGRREVPAVALVEHEATGIRALMRGADGVLNLRRMEAPEIVGLVNRVARRQSVGARVERALHLIESSLAHCRQ